MRVLLLHNRYQFAGGEDVVVQEEKALLETNEHDVTLLEVNNDDITGLVKKAAVAANTIYSHAAKKRVKVAIANFHPDIVHVHNFFPRLSPAVYDACQEAGVPVVQTLHNYRLLCPNSYFFRNSRVCEDCLGKFIPWPGVAHGCYRGSRVGTAMVAAMLTVHRARRTWTERVNAYIALTEFARQKFIQGGLPAQKIIVKPNFVYPDPGIGEGRGGYALFVGRLSPEKGLDTLLNAWERLGKRVPLKIVGDGPLATKVQAAAAKLPGVEYLGRKPVQEVHALMGDAAFLIFPSQWYETFGRVAVEAFARGTPAIASHIGAVAEVVTHGNTGFLFHPGDPQDLATQVEYALSHPSELAQMRRHTRSEFEAKYTAAQNYQKLMEIYAFACNAL